MSLKDEDLIHQIEYLLPDRSSNEKKIRAYLEKRDRESALHIINQIMRRMDDFQSNWPGATLPELFVAYRQSNMNIENCLSSINDSEVRRSFSDMAKNPAKFLEEPKIIIEREENEINSNQNSNSSSDSDSFSFSDSEDDSQPRRGRPRRSRGRIRGSRGRGTNRGSTRHKRIKLPSNEITPSIDLQVKTTTRRRGRPSRASRIESEMESKLQSLKRQSTFSDIWDESIGIDESSPLKNISHEWFTDGTNYIRVGPESQFANSCMAINPLRGYTDFLTKTLMTQPQIDRHGYVLDKSTWNHWYYRNDENLGETNHTHPFTNEPIKSMRDLDLQNLTLDNIAEYQNKILAIDLIAPNNS